MSWLPVIVAGVLSGGTLGGIALLLKLRPERRVLTIDLSEKAVVIQGQALDTLQEENARLKEGLDELRVRVLALETEGKLLREEGRALREENARLKTENEGLRERIQLLETDISGLHGPVTDEAGDMVERRDVP